MNCKSLPSDLGKLVERYHKDREKCAFYDVIVINSTRRYKIGQMILAENEEIVSVALFNESQYYRRAEYYPRSYSMSAEVLQLEITALLAGVHGISPYKKKGAETVNRV